MDRKNSSPARPVAANPGLPEPLSGPDLDLESELFWEKYKLPIAVFAALLVAGLIGYEIYQVSHSNAVAAASAELNAAKTPADFQKVIDDHGGTSAAANAYLLMARKQADAKDYAGAEKSFRAFVEKFPKHPLAPNALIGAGSTLESRNLLDQARSTYQTAAASYQNSYVAPGALLAEATVLKAQRKIEEARRIYENVIATYPKSDESQEATQELRYLHVLPPLRPSPHHRLPPLPRLKVRRRRFRPSRRRR